MSSSTERGGARAPRPPDQLASFYKLVNKVVIAGVLCRYARVVELAAQASVDAAALFGGDSLVLADIHMCGSVHFAILARDASGAEEEALNHRSWALLLLVLPILLRRLDANTLLLGSLREEELDYEAHAQAVAKKASNKPVPAPTRLRVSVSASGYNLLLSAAYRSLNHLTLHFWAAAERRSVESFVLRALDVIPRMAEMHAGLAPKEADIVAFMEQYMKRRYFEHDFRSAVLRKWRSEAVSSVLRAHGVLQTGIAKHEQSGAEFDARQRADIAKHGLRDCALPSCSKTEKTVKEFAGCSGCRSVVYCSLEHQALDWRAHKKVCREKEAARLAEEGTKNDETGAGAAAA